MARIAVGGMQHETNTFSAQLATLVDFEAPDAWPGLTRGPALFEAVAGINLPAAGFVAEARGLRHDLVPLTWGSAQPSGRVTRQAFEHVSALLLDDIRAAGALDAVYLDLHGAMVAEHVDDADGELLRRVRELVGSHVTVVASLDYHANLSPRMAREASALVAYRTYPHVDMAEAGARAARCLHDLLGRPHPVVALELHAAPDAVRRARTRGAIGTPVVLADTQDNPGAGGNGDTTGLLRALIEQKAEDAVLGLLIDPASATRAHEVGQGANVAFALGGKSAIPGDAPFNGEFTVERLGDGRFTCTGPMFKGFRMTLGNMALLKSKAAPGVRVVLASRKCQAADQEMFRHVGVEPRRCRVVALKSSVHFRADFEPIAKEVLVVKAPGPALADPAEFRWKKLRKGVRLRPLGPVHA